MRQTQGPAWDGEEEEEASDRRWSGDGEASVDTVVCPSCKSDVYEEAEQCPRCGEYLTQERAVGRWPWWVMVGIVLAMLIAVIFVVSPPLR